MIVATARRHGVDPRLALAVGWQESGWNQRQVSVANAIGVMQVIPSSGQWASEMAGRRLNLLNTQDNITAGVVILRSLTRSANDPRPGHRRLLPGAVLGAEARDVRRHQGLRRGRQGPPRPDVSDVTAVPRPGQDAGHGHRTHGPACARWPALDLLHFAGVFRCHRVPARACARRALPRPVAHRRRRNGVGLPRPGHPARPRRRPEGDAPRPRPGRGVRQPVPPRGALGGAAVATPTSSSVFDQGEDDGQHVPGHGVRPRPDPARGDAGRGPAHAAGGPRHHGPGPAGARRGPPRRHHPPRRQAREHHPARGRRHREGRRLRPGPRRDDPDHDVADRRAARHGRLPLPRAGRARHRRRPQRRLRRRADPVRDAHRHQGVHRRHPHPHRLPARARLGARPVVPGELGAAELDALVALATARDPDQRPADAGEFLSRGPQIPRHADARPSSTAGPRAPRPRTAG